MAGKNDARGETVTMGRKVWQFRELVIIVKQEADPRLRPSIEISYAKLEDRVGKSGLSYRVSERAEKRMFIQCVGTH